MRQIEWSAERYGMRWSRAPISHRFSIVRTTSGYTVCDHSTRELARVTTFAAAKAWAGARVGERCVRH